MTRSTHRRGTVFAALAAAALTLSACAGGGSGSTDSASDGPYKIGVLLGLTGTYSAVAEPQQKALELFEQNLEEQGGINGHPVEFVYLDTGSDESQAVNQLRKLATQENVIGVVGPSSTGEGIALKPIAQSLGLPTIAIASGAAIVDPVDAFMYKEFPSATDAVNAQLAYAEAQGLTRVAILSPNNAYGQEPAGALPELVDEYGLELVGSEVFPPDATDMTSQLSVLERANPDVVLVWAISPANAIIAKNAADIDFPAVLFQGSGAAAQAYIDLGGGATDGTLLVGSKILVDQELPESDPQYDTITQFADSWRATYDDQPNQFAGGAWDAMLIMTAALEKGEIDPSNLTEGRKALQTSLDENIQSLPGVIAVYTFSPDVHGPEGIAGLAVIGVENGAFTLVASDAGGE